MIKAKKHFGQNFLKDQGALEKITQAISKETPFIVEIGPGLGDLTQKLLGICRVKAIEIDDELIPLLEKKFHQELKNADLTLLNLDACKAFTPSLHDDEYVLVANLPYYVSTHLILQALEDKNCKQLIVMIQKELALKFCATEGQSDFCALSVLAGLICERELLFELKPESFDPAPKVDSAVISLKRKANYDEIVDIKAFQAFLKQCFCAPRKQLANNLKAHKKQLLQSLNELGLKENVRASELSVKSYLKIFTDLKDK